MLFYILAWVTHNTFDVPILNQTLHWTVHYTSMTIRMLTIKIWQPALEQISLDTSRTKTTTKVNSTATTSGKIRNKSHKNKFTSICKTNKCQGYEQITNL